MSDFYLFILFYLFHLIEHTKTILNNFEVQNALPIGSADSGTLVPTLHIVQQIIIYNTYNHTY